VAAVHVEGFGALIRAADRAGKETKKKVRDRVRAVGESVRKGAQQRFAPVDARTAAHYGVTVRQSGLVTVEQRLRRTTGRRPDFGLMQMVVALDPAAGSAAPPSVTSVSDIGEMTPRQ
jgi:hypothetical protein